MKKSLTSQSYYEATANRNESYPSLAGDITAEGPTLVAGIDTIDVSSTSTDWLALNHSLFAERTNLIEDIARLLQTGQRPPDSRLPVLIKVPTSRGDYWRFP